jgi:hypothetical protein
MRQSQVSWESIRWPNAYTPQFWYAGVPTRPKLQDIAVKAFSPLPIEKHWLEVERAGSNPCRVGRCANTSSFPTPFASRAELYGVRCGVSRPCRVARCHCRDLRPPLRRGGRAFSAD